MLALPPANPDIPATGLIHSHICLVPGNFEPAGHTFDKFVRMLEFARDPANESKTHHNHEEDDPDKKPIDMSKMNAKRRKKSITVMRSEDYYEVLNLDQDRTAVTDDQIKKSYRQLSLLYHPDKHDEGKYDEIAKEQWLKIQEAYETLVDPEKRRKYDCSITFNDAIPEKFDVEKSDFWEVFGPVFRRNAYFSKKQPVPGLGAPEEPFRKVLEFYDFWEKFDSWREFTHEEEYDLNQAESRGERRWMEQENRRLKSSLIKAEKARITKLVNFAYANDPRIQKHLQKEEEEKQQRKQEKKNQKEKQKQEEEKRRNEYLRVEQEKKDKEEEQKRLENEEKQRKIQRKKEIERELRDTAKDFVKDGKCDDYFLDEVIFKLKEDEVLELIETIREGQMLDTKSVDGWVKDQVRRRTEADTKARESSDQKPAPKLEWTQQEINLLTKGVVKFPPGMLERWKRIAQYIGGRFSEQECADKAKLMKTQHIKELKKREEEEKAEINGTKEPPKKKPQEAETTDKKESAKTDVPAPPKDKDSDPANWTQEQQKALEAAMKKYPATLAAKERWEKIASDVEGKTMKDCVERFKYLKEKLKK